MMIRKKNLTVCLLLVIILCPFFLSSQQLPTGGYQGGTHGNIRFTEWTGEVNDNWNEPGNWCPAVVPDAQDDVVIPVTATRMPEVKEAGLSCKSITLEPGATLTIKPGYTLTVNGREVE